MRIRVERGVAVEDWDLVLSTHYLVLLVLARSRNYLRCLSGFNGAFDSLIAAKVK